MLKFLTGKLKVLKTQLKSLIVFSAFYLIAIILGVIFSHGDCNTVLYTNAVDYHLIIMSSKNSVFTCFFNCFLVGAFLSALIICCGFSKFTIPIICVIVFYRGLVLGSCAVVFFTLSGLSGIIVFVILTLPSHAIITAGLIVASVLNYGAHYPNCKNKVNVILINALICALFALVSALYFLLVTAIVVRPINSLF